jgi:plastocyanin
MRHGNVSRARALATPFAIALGLALSLASISAPCVEAQQPEELDNKAVISLVRAGLDTAVIIQKIKMSRPRFDLSVSGLLALNSAKVPPGVILAMQLASAPAQSAEQPSTGAAGRTHVVKMFGDENGYRFEPASLTIRRGDSVKWVLVSGGPHNVRFEPAGIPHGSAAGLASTMPNQVSPFQSPMLMNEGEEYTMSFADVPTGVYRYVCAPHLPFNMRAKVTVVD